VRRAFVDTLVEIAARDPRVLLLTGDLGFSVLEPFAQRFPGRFWNVGVAEQNMIGVATGLADAGFLPFCWSIATFATLRPYEMIRNGPVLHGLPVRIAATGGGFEYGPNGPTHWAVEDLAALRALPDLAVVGPADAPQACAALQATWDAPGPIYYRLGKDERPPIPGLDGRFALGRADLVIDGEDLLFVALGPIAHEAVDAARRLAGRGVRAGVLVVATLTPPPDEDLARALARVPLAVAVETHVLAGGLGSLVAETIAERGLACRLLRRGARSLAAAPAGSRAFLERAHGLDAESLAEAAIAALDRPRRERSAPPC
jgi:transketolase